MRASSDRLFKIVLALFAGAIMFSLAGLLVLRLVPSAMGLFGPYYPQLVKGPTWTYMVALPVLVLLMYRPTVSLPTLLFFAGWGCLIGAASELIGTTTGVPFGDYAYGAWLGPKIFGHVPYLIPPSWFAMSLLSLDLAQRVVRPRPVRILVAALFMVLWDVSLDPAMSRAFPFWTYAADGFYFGMPLVNWVGWLGVSLVIIAGYEYIGGGLPSTSRWAPLVYLLNCAFPLFICLLHGLPLAFLIGAAATAVPLLAVWLRRHTVPASAHPQTIRRPIPDQHHAH